MRNEIQIKQNPKGRSSFPVLQAGNRSEFHIGEVLQLPLSRRELLFETSHSCKALTRAGSGRKSPYAAAYPVNRACRAVLLLTESHCMLCYIVIHRITDLLPCEPYHLHVRNLFPLFRSYELHNTILLLITTSSLNVPSRSPASILGDQPKRGSHSILVGWGSMEPDP